MILAFVLQLIHQSRGREAGKETIAKLILLLFRRRRLLLAPPLLFCIVTFAKCAKMVMGNATVPHFRIKFHGWPVQKFKTNTSQGNKPYILNNWQQASESRRER